MRRLPLALVAPLLVAPLLLVAAARAGAQGFPGGGMGGPGGRGGMGGPGRGGMRRPGGEDATTRLRDMAALKPVLKHVDGLSRAQKDSLRAVETRYREHFTQYGDALRRRLAASRDAGGPPDPEELRTLLDGAEALRRAELDEARAVLATDAQRAAFDANVAALAAERAKRREERRERMDGRGAGGGMPPATD